MAVAASTDLPKAEQKAAGQPQADNRWLWRYLSVHPRTLIGAMATGIIGGIGTALEPFFVGVIVDHLREGVDLDVIARDVIALIGFGLLTVIAFFAQRYFSGEVAYTSTNHIRRDLFDNLLTLDQGFFSRHQIGDLISRMVSDTDHVWRLAAIGALRGPSSATVLVFAAVLLLSVNVPLTLVVFAVLAVTTALQVKAGVQLAPVFEDVQAQGGAVAALVQDTASGIQTIKTFGREEGAAATFARENEKYRDRWLFFRRRNEPVGMLPNMISQLTTGIVVLFGGILTVNGALTIGNFTQFLLYLTLISQVLLQLGTIYQRYQQTRGALARLSPMLATPSVRDQAGAVEYQPEKQGTTIEFDHITVERDGATLLRDVTLTIPTGQVVAFVGPTGCGKTLLANLLARVYDPNGGEVRLGGRDVREYTLHSLRAAMAYVPQATFLFSQTLDENVRMGRDDIDEEAVTRALHISRLSNDLPQLPHGLETLVGEKGVMLSGGQKQRVAIARAVVREPAILILDDALSSVDMHTAADILHELRAVLRSRTSIIIAHRVATVKDADWIVVMDEGAIVEQGTHDDLVQQEGLYARMVERELHREDDAALPLVEPDAVEEAAHDRA